MPFSVFVTKKIKALEISTILRNFEIRKYPVRFVPLSTQISLTFKHPPLFITKRK